mmetsp:Transcript_7303/g.18933  ORF Transcript_7303/g.18933 Transcript_7303/m.18933 type:complete len:236 (+) Transcript_7303:964-1671(+)
MFLKRKKKKSQHNIYPTNSCNSASSFSRSASILSKSMRSASNPPTVVLGTKAGDGCTGGAIGFVVVVVVVALLLIEGVAWRVRILRLVSKVTTAQLHHLAPERLGKLKTLLEQQGARGGDGMPNSSFHLAVELTGTPAAALREELIVLRLARPVTHAFHHTVVATEVNSRRHLACAVDIAVTVNHQHGAGAHVASKVKPLLSEALVDCAANLVQLPLRGTIQNHAHASLRPVIEK